MREQKHPVIIFSVYRKELSEQENASRHDTVTLALNKASIPFVECVGCFEGIEEKSIILHQDHEETALRFASGYSQDCVLYVEEDNSAIIQDVRDDSKVQYLGKLVAVGNNKPNGDYTYRKDIDTYFQVK